jgi:hypothetical protein
MYHIGKSVSQTSDSGYIMTGYTAFSGSINVWLIKTNSLGDVIWTNTYGGSGWDEGSYVQQTNDNGYIIVGRTDSYGSGNYDVWLIKTDTFGDTVWTRTYGGIDSDDGNSVQQTNDNGYIITGTTELSGPGNSDLWIIKTDSNGDAIWTQTYGGIDQDEGYSVQKTTDNGYIVSGRTYSNGSLGKHVWLLKLASDPSDVKDIQVTRPQGFALYQNYPNPFNPTTTIGFGLQDRSNIKIIILNSIGEEVAVVLNEAREPGYHQVEFNAANLPSGVYFYRLQTGNFFETKKMLLLK